MPNWCEGTLKVRGKIENIKRFITEEFDPPIEIEKEYDDGFVTKSTGGSIYFKGTYRGFCKYVDYFFVDFDEPDDETIILIPYKQAWDINTDELLNICQKFGVDMRIQAFEKGMQFSRFIEIVNGEISKNLELHYNNWKWDCPCPNLGG